MFPSLVRLLIWSVLVAILPLTTWAFFSPYQGGESLEMVIDKLKTDPLLVYQDKQVLMTVPVLKDAQICYEADQNVRTLVAPGQGGYIKQIYFYFKDERLSSLSLFFSPKCTSYYEVFLKLSQKYGQPAQVRGPDLVEWENGSVLIRLTRPINVKYLDKALLEQCEKDYKEAEEKNLSVKQSIFDRL